MCANTSNRTNKLRYFAHNLFKYLSATRKRLICEIPPVEVENVEKNYSKVSLRKVTYFLVDAVYTAV